MAKGLVKCRGPRGSSLHQGVTRCTFPRLVFRINFTLHRKFMYSDVTVDSDHCSQRQYCIYFIASSVQQASVLWAPVKCSLILETRVGSSLLDWCHPEPRHRGRVDSSFPRRITSGTRVLLGGQRDGEGECGGGSLVPGPSAC